MREKKLETMYERLAKVVHTLSLNFFTHVKNTRQWKSTLTQKFVCSFLLSTIFYDKYIEVRSLNKVNEHSKLIFMSGFLFSPYFFTTRMILKAKKERNLSCGKFQFTTVSCITVR